jgi:hypothetical protein
MPNMKTVGQRILKFLGGQAFLAKALVALTWWPQNQKWSSTIHDQSEYQTWRLWVKEFLTYWSDKEKPADGQTAERPDRQADSSIPPYNCVVRGYYYQLFEDKW